MHEYFSNVYFIIIAVTSLVSVIAFSNRSLLIKLIFHEESILGPRHEWYRILSHALVHGGWIHLIFNMVTLYFFAPVIEAVFGSLMLVIIYVASIAAGGLLSLFFHRKQPNYTALGASGGVVGILFSSIALNPFSKIYIFPFPVGISSWLFGVCYLAFTVYAIRSMPESQIGHDAHLGGAVAGILFTLALAPQILIIHGIYILFMMIPVVIGLLLMLNVIKMPKR